MTYAEYKFDILLLVGQREKINGVRTIHIP